VVADALQTPPVHCTVALIGGYDAPGYAMAIVTPVVVGATYAGLRLPAVRRAIAFAVLLGIAIEKATVAVLPLADDDGLGLGL
jgi:hypothetical protein